MNSDRINEIVDRVEEELLRIKEEDFKDYWRYQLIIEKKFEEKCLRCSFRNRCFHDGILFNEDIIEEVCMDMDIKKSIKRLVQIMDEKGCQCYNLGNELHNRWYNEVNEK